MRTPRLLLATSLVVAPLLAACEKNVSSDPRPATSSATSTPPGAPAMQPTGPGIGRLPQEIATGNVETVATFDRSMPTGVAVSREGRIFVSFPRWVTIQFPPTVALPTSYLNDVRFDVNRGKAGFAYISDSSSSGPNAIVVVDLDSKKAWRRLSDHPSVKAAPGFLAIVEGRPLYRHAQPGQARTPFAAGVDGIEVSPDGKTVYYCPLGSRHLYSVSADALSDPGLPDAKVAATVKDLGEKGASDGLVMGADGRLYLTAYENDAILRRDTDGTLETVATDTRMLWPDSMAIGSDGYLYFTVNQLERQPLFHGGQDLRQKPYALLRTRVGNAPVHAAR